MKKGARTAFTLVLIILALCVNFARLGTLMEFRPETRVADDYSNPANATTSVIRVADDYSSPVNATTSVASILHRFEGRNGGDDIIAKPSSFLVLCGPVKNPSFMPLFPMFSNFTTVRLDSAETPPPWNATAFLVLPPSGACAKHPYVLESIERRRKSPFLVNPRLPAPGIDGRGGTAWVHGVHWPNFSGNGTSFLRVIRNRPAIIKILGEVFWRKSYGSCKEMDFILYREAETLYPDCLTIHFLQGVTSTVYLGMAEGDSGARNMEKILRKTLPHPHQPAMVNYTGFCSFMVRYSSNKLAEMFTSTHYDIDAIVRHMFFLQLSEYKPCERKTDCAANGPYRAFKCTVGDKFHITMENTQIDGYVSEKLFNGALGGGVPIYFGAPDVGKYFNEKSFIHCNPSRKVIEEMRSFYPRRPRPRPFLFGNSSQPTDEELLSWADKYLRPQLDPCVKRVIELDTDDDKYMATLREPFILRDDIMSGVYPLRGVTLAYNLLRSENENDFVTVSPSGKSQ